MNPLPGLTSMPPNPQDTPDNRSAEARGSFLSPPVLDSPPHPRPLRDSIRVLDGPDAQPVGEPVTFPSLQPNGPGASEIRAGVWLR